MPCAGLNKLVLKFYLLRLFMLIEISSALFDSVLQRLPQPKQLIHEASELSSIFMSFLNKLLSIITHRHDPYFMVIDLSR